VVLAEHHAAQVVLGRLLVDVAVREGHRRAPGRRLAVPLVEPLHQPGEEGARLVERRLVQRRAVGEPAAVALLHLPALHLEHQQAAHGVGQHEVGLAEQVPGVADAQRVPGRPAGREPGLEP
jgi:hypothetical protein